MNEQVEIALELAAVLEDHADEIAATWAEIVRNRSDSRYQQIPLVELKTSTSRALLAFVEALKTGSPLALETYLHEVSLPQYLRQRGREASQRTAAPKQSTVRN